MLKPKKRDGARVKKIGAMTEEQIEALKPRPPCAQCGGPATCVVSIEVKDLVLERDAGLGSAPYWTTCYRNTQTSIETRLCRSCVGSSVRLTTHVIADVEKPRKG